MLGHPKSESQHRGVLRKQSTLEEHDGDIEPLLDDYIADMEEEDLDIPLSEQELIVQGCDELLENALRAFGKSFKSVKAPLDDSSDAMVPVDRDEVLRHLKPLKAASILKISEYLDERLTRLRRSFQAYRYSTITKLSEARKSISEYKKTYELGARKCEEDRVKILLNAAESRYRVEMDDLSNRFKLLRSSYETASGRNEELVLEKLGLEEKCTKLEHRALRADDMVANAQRRIEELEAIQSDLTAKVEDLKAQKLLRQQMGNRRASKSGGRISGGSPKLSLRRSSSTSSTSIDSSVLGRGGGSVSRPQTPEVCSKCEVLEEMLAAARKQIGEMASMNRAAERQPTFSRSHLGSCLEGDSGTFGPDSSSRSWRVGSETGAAAGGHVSALGGGDSVPRRDTASLTGSTGKISIGASAMEDSGVLSTEMGGSTGGGSLSLDAVFEEEDEGDAEGDNGTRTSAKFPLRIQSVKEQDRHYRVVGDAAGEGVADGTTTVEAAVEHQEVKMTAAPRISMSVFPDPKPEPVQMPKPAGISMQAAIVPSEDMPRARLPLTLRERPPVEKTPPDDQALLVQQTPSVEEMPPVLSQLPHDQEHEEDEGELTRVAVEIKREVTKVPHEPVSPVVVVMLREEKTPSPEQLVVEELSIAEAAPVGNLSSPSRSTEEYQTATQALEKRLSSRVPASANQESGDDNMSVGQRDIAAALNAPSPKAPPLYDPRIPSDVEDSVFNMLKEAVNAQRHLEAENLALREDNDAIHVKMEELVSFVRTQDHIASLKLKEREVLLRELTEQVNELRVQLNKDRRLFAEMDAAARSGLSLPNVAEGRACSRFSGASSKRVDANLYKLSIVIDESTPTLAPRPYTASPSRKLMTLQCPPSQRPSSSPSLEQAHEEPSSLLPPTVNLSHSLKGYCKSSPNAKPSLFSSRALGSYEYGADKLWEDDNALFAENGTEGNARAERKARGRKKAEDLRKKMALLIAHQDIVVKRFQVEGEQW